MGDAPLVGSESIAQRAARGTRTLTSERVAILYARFALGAAFLSAVADRFGLWGKYGGWGTFANFMKYTAEVNSFMPAFIIPFLAWSATIFETAFGIALILGLWVRWSAMGSAILLAFIALASASLYLSAGNSIQGS